MAREYMTEMDAARIENAMNDLWVDFQDANDIFDGGLPPELEVKLEATYNDLLDIMDRCMAWQVQNNQ